MKIKKPKKPSFFKMGLDNPVKNLTCMKIGPNSMQNSRNPQDTKFLSGCASGNLTETTETNHRIKCQSYVWDRAMLGLDPKGSKGKFQNFKMNTMSIFALHT